MRQVWRGMANGRESALRVDESGVVSVWMMCSDWAFHETESPYLKSAALVELLRDVDTREQSRLTRCAAESRRLSLEECCHWLTLADWTAAARDVVMRRPGYLTRVANALSQEARNYVRRRKDGDRLEYFARQCMFVSWLCREALRRIDEERR